MEESLAACGHSVVAAPDGQTALKNVGEQEFDLNITDLAMPGMSGHHAVVDERGHDAAALHGLMVDRGRREIEADLRALLAFLGSDEHAVANHDEFPEGIRHG